MTTPTPEQPQPPADPSPAPASPPAGDGKPAQPAAPPRSNRRRRAVAIILGVFGLLLLGAYIRGTWADTTPRDPATVEEGIICHLYQTPDGRKPVRCAVLLDHPIDRVWSVLTDYPAWSETFPTLSAQPVKVTRPPPGVRPDGVEDIAYLSGVASSVLGDWPFAIRVEQRRSPEKRVISWTGQRADADVRRNEGSFTLTPKEGGKTLLVYSLDVELTNYPAFVVRNILLSRQPGAVRSLVDRLNRE